MKFFADVIVHQHDSAEPDYQHLHHLLAEAGFVQRALDGTRTQQASSGLYMREERVLTSADVEHDLRFVLESFPHPCSFHLHQAVESKHLVSGTDTQRTLAMNTALDSTAMCAASNGSYLQ